jgi:ABC-type sulfate transport system permease component
MIGERWFAGALCGALALALTFLTLPVVAIFVEATPRELVSSLDDPGVGDALWLSLRTTITAVVVILAVGTPAAFVLATRRFRGRELVITLVELPLVLPPAVAGVGLLAGLALAWGRALAEFGATLIFAGSFQGRTQTAPLAIYERLGTDFTAALALSAVLVAASAAVLLSVKLVSGLRAADAAR